MRHRSFQNTALAFALASVVVPLGMAPTAHAADLDSRPFFNWPGSSLVNGDSTGADPAATRELIARIKGAPAGSAIRLATYSLSDPEFTKAVIAADKRGVKVKVILHGKQCDESQAAEDLVAALRHADEDKTKVKCRFITRSTSARGGMHSKFFLFSTSSATKHVTLVGSANATKSSRDYQYADLFRYGAREDVYTTYRGVFDEMWERKRTSDPYLDQPFNGGAGGVWVFPLPRTAADAIDAARASEESAAVKTKTRSLVRQHDPVIARLQGIAAGSATTIHVSNFAIWGVRGQVIVDELARHVRNGSTVRVLIGSGTSEAVVDALVAKNVPVRRAYAPACGKSGTESCNYNHMKGMSATWLKSGERMYRAWTGSDNWGMDGYDNDEVTAKVSGQQNYTLYRDFMNKMWAKSRTP